TPDLTLEVVAEALRLGHIQGAFIDGAACDGADDAGRTRQQQLLDIAEIVDAAGGDHRDAAGRGQCGGGFDVAALHHAVLGDVGINDGRYAVGFETPGQVGRLHAGHFRPAIGGD